MNNIAYTRKNLLFITALSSLFIFILSCFAGNNLFFLSILGILHICILTYCMYKINRNFFSISTLFILLIFLFHSGYSFLLILGDMNDIKLDISVNSYIMSQLFVQLSLTSITVSYLFFFNRIKLGEKKSNLNIELFGKVILYIFIFTLPIKAYCSIFYESSLTYSSGYLATFEAYNTPFLRIVNYLQNLCLPSFILLLFLNKTKVKMLNKFILIVCLMLFISMLSGRRSLSIAYLICIIFIYYNFVRKITKKEVGMLFMLTLCLLVSLPIISVLRSLSDGTGLSIMMAQSANDSLGGSYLQSFFNEFGGSVYSLISTMDAISVSSQIQYNYGLTYLFSPFQAIPFLSGYLYQFDWYKYSICYIDEIRLLRDYRGFPFGGSILGELYYNFGWFSPFLIGFIGYILSLVELVISNIKNNGQILLLYTIVIITIPNIIMWIRDYYSGLFGGLILITYILIYSFCYRRKKYLK